MNTQTVIENFIFYFHYARIKLKMYLNESVNVSRAHQNTETIRSHYFILLKQIY